MNRNQLSVSSVVMATMLLLTGCEGLRYAPTEAQRENAWLHREVCAAAARTAADENASDQLCGLADLAHRQSGVFVMDYGLPESISTGYRHGQAALDRATLDEAEGVLVQAETDSVRRPDVFKLADGAMELGIALAGLVGGVYGLRIAGYLKAAREKSQALKEIIRGNELFKQLYPEQAERFKNAQNKQSAATRELVTGLKTG